MKFPNSPGSVYVWLVLVAAIGGAIAGVVPAARAAQEGVDRPRALLHIAAEPPRIVLSDVKKGLAPVQEVGSYARYLETQRPLIKSRLVLEEALRSGARGTAISQLASIKNRPNPIAWLEQNLEVTNLKDTELLQVSLRPGLAGRTEAQVAIINATVKSYVVRVANEEHDQRSSRLQTLKKLSEHYRIQVDSRRQDLLSLLSQLGSNEALLKPEKQALSRLVFDLHKQRIQLSLDRAEAETLLNRRKQAANAGTEQARKEIDALQERLAVLTARGNALDKELEKVRTHLKPQPSELDLEIRKREIAEIEQASRKISTEIESLSVELEAPPRIGLIERAAMPAK